MSRVLFPFLFFCLAAGHLGAQGHDEDDDRPQVDTTIAFSRGVVDLTIVSGSISVKGWSRQEAKVSATVEDGSVAFEHSGSRITLDVRSTSHRVGDATFDLVVPTGTRVLMRSVSGDLSAHGVRGEVEARAVSGNIELTDAANKITFETVSGDVTGARLAGDVHGVTVAGSVELSDVGADIEVQSVSGDIRVGRARSKFVHTESVSGTLGYTTTAIDPAGRYEFHTHSGDVELTLPANTGARVALQTFSGSLDTAFPVTLRPGMPTTGHDSGQYQFTLGGGGARLTVETFSGDITLRRGSRP